MPRPLTGPFSFFGRWIIALCDLYAIPSVSALAQRAGISENTLTECMKEGKPGPTRNTVDQIWKAFEALTEDSPLHDSLPVSAQLLYNIAGFSTPQQQEYSRRHLLALEYFAKREEFIQQQEEHIKRLEADIARLESRRRPRSS